MPTFLRYRHRRDDTVFKLRRRTAAETVATDQPFCAMCGTTIRVDATSGRCALGHRVAAPGALAVPVPVAEDDTAVLVGGPASAYEATTALPAIDTYDEPSGAYAGEGLYEAYSSADAAGRAVTWDDVVAPTTSPSNVYDDYLTWAEPTTDFSPSSPVAVQTPQLPVADYGDVEPTPATKPVLTPVEASDLLEELDDATHARRRTLGTIGATVAVTAVVGASIAVLPFF